MTMIDEGESSFQKAAKPAIRLLITLLGLAAGAALGIVIALSTGLIDLIC